MPDTPETVLALDFGLRRIGAAIGQTVTASASPLCVVRNSQEGPAWDELSKLVKEWQPDRIIVGLPMHADGRPSDMADIVHAFIAKLHRFKLPIETQDERHTSQEAAALLKVEREAGIRGRIRKETVDCTAAVLIAERWLRENSQLTKINTE